MESAHRAPIAQNGIGCASRVIGVVRCRSDRRGHDERSVSGQLREGNHRVRFSPRIRRAQRLRGEVAFMALGCKADARELVGQRTRGLVVIRSRLDRHRPRAQPIERPADVATAAARSTDRAPWVSSIRRHTPSAWRCARDNGYWPRRTRAGLSRTSYRHRWVGTPTSPLLLLRTHAGIRMHGAGSLR